MKNNIITQEDKELLLRDLSARLPYGVKVQPKYDTNEAFKLYSLNVDDNEIKFFTFQGKAIEICEYGKVFRPSNRLIFKPYLFPLSSMTEEQKEEYTFIVDYISSDDSDTLAEGEFIYVDLITELMHFYNKYHLDYRGLIPKGLALDATGLNIY